MASKLEQRNFRVPANHKIHERVISEDFLGEQRGSESAEQDSNFWARLFDLPGDPDHIVRLEMPVQVQSDDERLVLRNDPVKVERAVLMLLNPEMDDFGGVIVFDQKIGQTQ